MDGWGWHGWTEQEEATEKSLREREAEGTYLGRPDGGRGTCGPTASLWSSPVSGTGTASCIWERSCTDGRWSGDLLHARFG